MTIFCFDKKAFHGQKVLLSLIKNEEYRIVGFRLTPTDEQSLMWCNLFAEGVYCYFDSQHIIGFYNHSNLCVMIIENQLIGKTCAWIIHKGEAQEIKSLFFQCEVENNKMRVKDNRWFAFGLATGVCQFLNPRYG